MIIKIMIAARKGLAIALSRCFIFDPIQRYLFPCGDVTKLSLCKGGNMGFTVATGRIF